MTIRISQLRKVIAVPGDGDRKMLRKPPPVFSAGWMISA